MKKIICLVLICILYGLCAFSQKRYYKGNTHAHCYPQSGDVTDTSYNAVNIIAQYKALGYDFLVFTDHGAWWNAKILTTPDFTVINGSEPGISGNGLWGHFTGLKMKARISGTNLTHQQMINNIYNQGAVPFINHPRYSQIPISALQIINAMKDNLHHMEMWNGVTVNAGGPDDISVWDSVLTTGRLMYGVASDDSHKKTNQGKGWIMVYASSKNEDTLVEAIRRGDFYPTTGIIIDTMVYSPTQIYVKSNNGEVIKFYGNSGSLLSTFNGSEATYKIKGDEGYVRAEISNQLGRRGWIQPMMISKTNSIRKTASLPEKFTLYQNYPNPFNPSTVIGFQLPVFSYTTLKIYDVLGRGVKTLINENMAAGNHSKQFNASNLSSGTYFYRLIVQPLEGTKAIIINKSMQILK